MLAQPNAYRVHWSTFYADRHAPDVDYIAIVDSDVIFHTYGIDAFLFEPPGDAAYGSQERVMPRPVIFGAWNSQFAFSAMAVQDTFPNISFMDTFPMVIRRDDFRALRIHIRERMALMTGIRTIGFDQALIAAARMVDIASKRRGWWASYE